MKALLVVLIAAGIFTIVPILYSIVGAFSGWVVGWFFSKTILGIFAQIGIENVAMWQIGLFLGFVGGFFKSSVNASSD